MMSPAFIIGIFIIVIGVLLLRSNNPASASSLKEPAPPLSGYLLYVLGLGLFLGALFFCYQVIHSSGGTLLMYLVIAITLFIAGKRVFSFASNADLRHAQNMQARLQAKQAHVSYEQAQISLETARQRAREQEELDAIRRAAEKQRIVADHNFYLEDNALKVKLTQLANAANMDVITLMSVVQKERFNELDVKKAADEARIKIEAGIIYEIRKYHEVLMIGRTIDGILEEIDQIKSSHQSPYLKERKIAEREEDLKFLQEDRRVKRQRLLQAHYGEDLGGSHPDTEL